MKSYDPRFLSLALTLTALVGPACDDLDALESTGVEARGGPGAYPPLNTSKLLDTDLAAVDTKGLALDGVRLVGVQVKRGTQLYPVVLSSLRAEAGELVGQVNLLLGAYSVEGDDFLDSVWTFELGPGPLHNVVKANLTAMQRAGDAGLSDGPGPSGGPSVDEPFIPPRKLDPERWLYTFEYLVGPDPVHVCEYDIEGGVQMVIFGDIVVNESTGDISERPNTLQFGCLSSALGKGVLWGYGADNPSPTGVTLEEFENSTRMVRADYCADGGSHTAPGQEVSMGDRWDINEHAALHTTEAAWKVGQGATCLKRGRLAPADRLTPLVCPDGHEIPLCASDSALESRRLTGEIDIWTKVPF